MARRWRLPAATVAWASLPCAYGRRPRENPWSDTRARSKESPAWSSRPAASWEGAVHLWEAAAGKLLHHWDMFGPLAFTPDDQTLVCSGWSDGKVRLLDPTTGKETRQFQAHTGGVWDQSLARDGKTVATAGRDSLLRLWDRPTGRSIQDFGGKQKSVVFRLALSPDSKLLASIHDDYAVRLWETATGKLVREYAEPDDVGSIAFSPDGKLLASTFSGVLGQGPLIRLREVATGKEIRQLRGQGDSLDAVAFSPDGRTVIWGGQHRKDLYLWEVATGQPRRRFSGHTGPLTCVAFSPNGRMMGSGSADASVLIWDASGQRQREQPTSSSLSTVQLDQLWTDLAAKDAATAYQAMCTLRALPRQAVLLCELHLKPVPRADVKRLAEALHNLDSDQFTVRDQATKDLESLGEAAESALRQALAGQLSVEVRRRVEQLLDRLEGAAPWHRERALELLEQVGGPGARRVLTALAHGAPQARLTGEAQAALDRLGR